MTTQKQIYLNTSIITLECDYFNEHPNPVSTVKATFLESLGVIVFVLLCPYLVS